VSGDVGKVLSVSAAGQFAYTTRLGGTVFPTGTAALGQILSGDGSGNFVLGTRVGSIIPPSGGCAAGSLLYSIFITSGVSTLGCLAATTVAIGGNWYY